MPIREAERHKYPGRAEWQAIRKRIQQRAGDKCEWCGVRNHAIGTRDEPGRFHESTGCGSPDDEKTIQIVCTTAHLDHDPRNSVDDNLAFLCQKCHNGHDAKHRAAGIRDRRDENMGQARLF